jgi:hypothetical protein
LKVESSQHIPVSTSCSAWRRREAHQQRTKILPTAFRFSVAANDEFLLLVELDLDPCAGAFSRLIFGAPAFADQRKNRAGRGTP